MKLHDIDWPYTKSSIIWFIMSAILASTIWFSCYFFVSTKHNALQTENRININLRRQIARAKHDASTIKQFRGAYLTLVERGVVGHEHRLSWVSSLRTIANTLKIRSAKYQLLAQTAVGSQVINTGGTVKILMSKMKLTLELSHELDLIRLLSALEQQQGHFSASKCSIKRNMAKIVVKANANNLTVLCDLDWYSFNTNNGAGVPNE